MFSISVGKIVKRIYQERKFFYISLKKTPGLQDSKILAFFSLAY